MQAKDFNALLGATLRQIRIENGLTQDELAKHSSLSRASIANMETGRQAMSAYQAYQIAKVLELKGVETLYPDMGSERNASGIGIDKVETLSDNQKQQVEALMADTEV